MIDHVVEIVGPDVNGSEYYIGRHGYVLEAHANGYVVVIMVDPRTGSSFEAETVFQDFNVRIVY